MNKLDLFLRDWTAKSKWKGKTIDEIMQIDDIPLWSFYHRSFTPHVMPKQLNTFSQIEKKESLSSLQKILLPAKAKMLRKYLWWNEKKKISYFRQKDINSAPGKKILFLSYTDHLTPQGTVFRLQQLINKVRQDEVYLPLVLFADPLSSSKYKKLLQHRTIYRYYTEEIAAIARSKSILLSKSWKDIPESAKKNLLKHEEMSLWPYLEPAFSFFFSHEFFYLTALYYEIAKKILQQEEIKAVVLTSQSGFFEKCFLAAASRLRPQIPVFQIQHGIGAGILDTTYATRRLIFSDYHKNELLSTGVKDKDLFITGPIVFDEMYKYIKNRSFNPSLPEKSIARTLLIITSPTVEDQVLSKEKYFQRIEHIISEMKAIPDLHLFLKLHPREKYIQKYQEIIKDQGMQDRSAIVQHLPREEFYQQLQNCDAVLNFGSTAGFEALIMDKPLLTIDIADLRLSHKRETYCLLILENDAGINIPYQEDIAPSIRKLFEEDHYWKQKRQEFIQKYCYKNDGKASERAAKVIYSLISQ